MSLSTKQHNIDMSQFATVNGELAVRGYSISQIAELAGSTPFYLYDSEKMNQKISSMRASFPERLHIHYAMKANPNPLVVKHIAGMVDGLDVASHKELIVALSAGVDAKNISMAGPAKSDADLRSAVSTGIVINVESLSELDRIYQISHELSLRPRLALRVNPDFTVKGTGMSMGGGSAQFGIDTEMLSEAVAKVEDKDDIVGLHIFSGSQNLNQDAIKRIIEGTFALAEKITTENQLNLRHLNIGGGMGIPYFAGDAPLQLKEIGFHLHEQLEMWHAKYPNSEVITELGRFIVGESGYYVCEVVDVKQSRGKTFVTTNGGLHHHLAASGNFGQVIRRNYPVIAASKLTEKCDHMVSVVGPLCTPLDTLAKDVELPALQPGDLVAICQSGAYGYTASPHLFLSHPLPAEVLL